MNIDTIIDYIDNHLIKAGQQSIDPVGWELCVFNSEASLLRKDNLVGKLTGTSAVFQDLRAFQRISIWYSFKGRLI